MDYILQLFLALAFMLIWYILSRDKKIRRNTRAMWMAAGFGVGGLIVAAILENLFLSEQVGLIPLAGDERTNASLIIGIIEEACKFVPLAVVIYNRPYFKTHIDGVLYFALAGLGFGLPENFLYTLDGGIVTGAGRLLLTPFFHAATTTIVGYYLARAKLKKGTIAGVVTALLAMIAIHAVYDYGLLGTISHAAFLSVFLTTMLTIVMFYFIRLAKTEDEKITE